ncbi:MAG: GTP-binding protein, partial [Planctomycetes bacterium]|nr:GTP-binding protein [Planctomycetota bacterium]
PTPTFPLAPDQVQYTNAKVLLVGDTSSGKTGLTERLAHDRPPQRTPSTSGTWSTQWPLKNLPYKLGWEREVWLWDFAGQADQRLIHQLYFDRTALVLLMFDSDREVVLPGLREWQQALARSKAHGAPIFLLAGRTDVGFRFDREKVRAFAKESGYEYFETSAETGIGIGELRQAMLKRIPWDELTPHNSPALFKRLKDGILRLRDEGLVLATFKELESVLRNRLSTDFKFADAQLDTVVSLLDGPGVVKELDFGSYILLRPEWINAYAQAVIRTLRASESGLGCLPVRSIMEGKLIFQTKQAGGKTTGEKRLGPADEKVVLQAMEQMLIERRLCLRQDGDLVFPSHCGMERPVGPVPSKFFASYAIRGFLDDIYASLVVKLAHCGAFKLKELWRDAADFATLADGRIVGIKLVRRDDGRGELLAHHSRRVTPQEQVIFASYIHEHLRERSTEEVPRLRYYDCPNCGEPVENRQLAMERLEQKGEKAEIRCQRCDKFIPLWDALEERFASKTLKEKIEALRRHENASLDSRRLGQLLVHEVSARLKSANQNCHEIPGDEDVAIDMVVEFTDDEGYGIGKHMYLQLKAGNAYLKKRKRDGAEVFAIKKQRWVKQWIRQDGPMMLVIGTFPDKPERASSGEKKFFAEVRWMEIGEMLEVESANGTKPVRQIVFNGDRLDAASVGWWRGEALTQIRAEVPAESQERLMKWADDGTQVTLAVLFTDIIGRKGMAEKATDADWSLVRNEQIARGKALIRKLDGFLVKPTGDGLMAVFRNALSALGFMLEMRSRGGGSVVNARQVAHLASVTPGQDAVFRQHVNFTTRLSGEALEGDIVVSDVFKKGIDAASSPRQRAMQWERITGVSFRGFTGKYDLWRLGRPT